VDSDQVVGSVKALVQQAALVLGEVVVSARLERLIAAQQRPGGERDLLRIEIRGRVLMREVFAVVAGRIPPAAMRIQELARRAGHGEVPVGALHLSSGALALEIVDDAGERIALQ
jgi:hypothetical protein